MSENIALLDMDGTVANFYEALDRDVRAILGTDYSTVSDRTRRMLEFTVRQKNGWYRDLEPIPFGIEIANLLREIGFDIMVLTKGAPRTLNSWTEKVEWCQKHIPFAKITITEDKGLVYGKLLVDDWPSYITRWLEHRPRGLVIMPDQRWNREFAHGQVARVSTSKDLEALRPTLEEIYKR